MSAAVSSRSSGKRSQPTAAWLNGYTFFAVSIMIVLALWQILAGIAAVVRGGLYVTPSGYTYSFSVTGWGWVVLLLGVLTGAAVVLVVQGRARGDLAAVVLASLSAIVNFLLIPVYPIWSLAIIALDVTLIWALTTPRRYARSGSGARPT